MKTLRVYKRTILERTGFKKYPYKQVDQITITYDDRIAGNHFEDINNPRLKIKFELVLETRNKKVLEKYINSLGQTESDKWQKSIFKQL